MSRSQDPAIARSVQAGLLAWVLPGAGHYILGHRGLAGVFFVAISVPYLAGVAIGGVHETVNPAQSRWLFLAEMGVGGYTTAFFALNASLGEIPADQLDEYLSYYPASEIATIYLAVAGLLNVLAIFDALMRAQTGGLPVFHHETAGQQSGGGDDG